MSSFLSRFLTGGLSLDGGMVDPSEARHMGQMHHFLPFNEVLVPRAREYAVSICLYSLNCREGSFPETQRIRRAGGKPTPGSAASVTDAPTRWAGVSQ